MPTSNIKPYSPYESYNANRALGTPQFFGQMQFGDQTHTFTPFGTAINPTNGVYGAQSAPAPVWGGGTRQPGLRGGERAGGETLAGGQSGQGGLAGASPDIATVTSTIDSSTPLYDPQQTNAYANQMASKALQAGSPRQVLKNFSRPGMSHDEGTLAAAMPMIARARSEAQNMLGMIPLQDQFANQNFQLQGQVQAGQETSALARLLQQLQQTQDMERNSAIQAVLNPLMGSVFG